MSQPGSAQKQNFSSIQQNYGQHADHLSDLEEEEKVCEQDELQEDQEAHEILKSSAFSQKQKITTKASPQPRRQTVPAKTTASAAEPSS